MDRKVTAVKKDRNGNIVALCNPGQSWSPRSKKDVVSDIRAGRKSYYVEQVPRRAYLRAVSGGVLQSKAGADARNSIEKLPLV
jgi:hypothetical protein